MRNLKQFYYKTYFEHVDFSDLKSTRSKTAIAQCNRDLCAPCTVNVIPCNPYVNTRLSFKVEYPGLVTGVGIGHEIGVEGEFKLGMHFDHTSGMPIIYGSSVKGVLREYFEEVYEGLNAKLIKAAIFGSDDNGNSTYSTSQYNRDIFFDAVVVKTGSDGRGRLLAPDSITPHKKGPLKDPMPLTFMKISSGCELEFRFHLVNTVDSDGNVVMDVNKKMALFREILATYGIGAKTNVGYGQLTYISR